MKRQGTKDTRWRLADLPTLVVIYDPARKAHVGNLGMLESHADFTAASRFFNLVRVDVRTIKDKKLRRAYRKGPHFTLYAADGKRSADIGRVTSARKVLPILKLAIARDFRTDGDRAVFDMGRILARRAWVEKGISLHQGKVICPDCGKRDHHTHAGMQKLQKEMRALVRKEAKLRRRPA